MPRFLYLIPIEAPFLDSGAWLATITPFLSAYHSTNPFISGFNSTNTLAEALLRAAI
jgi:hypothetical protein